MTLMELALFNHTHGDSGNGVVEKTVQEPKVAKSRNRAARRPPCHCPPLSLGPSAHPSVGGPGAAPSGGLGGARHDGMRTGVVRSELRAALPADCGRGRAGALRGVEGAPLLLP